MRKGTNFFVENWSGKGIIHRLPFYFLREILERTEITESLRRISALSCSLKR